MADTKKNELHTKLIYLRDFCWDLLSEYDQNFVFDVIDLIEEQSKITDRQYQFADRIYRKTTFRLEKMQ